MASFGSNFHFWNKIPSISRDNSYQTKKDIFFHVTDTQYVLNWDTQLVWWKSLEKLFVALKMDELCKCVCIKTLYALM